MAKNNLLPSAPNKTLWTLALITGGVGILVRYVHVDYLSSYNYIMLLIGFALLAIGTSLRKM